MVRKALFSIRPHSALLSNLTLQSYNLFDLHIIQKYYSCLNIYTTEKSGLIPCYYAIIIILCVQKYKDQRTRASKKQRHSESTTPSLICHLSRRLANTWRRFACDRRIYQSCQNIVYHLCLYFKKGLIYNLNDAMW
jgi:hypothetical protein